MRQHTKSTKITSTSAFTHNSLAVYDVAIGQWFPSKFGTLLWGTRPWGFSPKAVKFPIDTVNKSGVDLRQFWQGVFKVHRRKSLPQRAQWVRFNCANCKGQMLRNYHANLVSMLSIYIDIIVISFSPNDNNHWRRANSDTDPYSGAWDVNSFWFVCFFIWYFGACESEDCKLKFVAKGKNQRKSQGGVSWAKKQGKEIPRGRGGQNLSFMVKEKKWPWNPALHRLCSKEFADSFTFLPTLGWHRPVIKLLSLILSVDFELKISRSSLVLMESSTISAPSFLGRHA